MHYGLVSSRFLLNSLWRHSADGTKPLPEPMYSGLLIDEVMWHSHVIYFALCAQANILYNEFKNCTFDFFANSANELKVLIIIHT